ncbi:MAG: hypothetical protein BWY95_02262 [Bacteroidetes bacterium ADurb.BinA104]|nr:MAG: hypothetical protein BWY95_02262 [Bacteroidetes bacterium ADurb.BinA104]
MIFEKAEELVGRCQITVQIVKIGQHKLSPGPETVERFVGMEFINIDIIEQGDHLNPVSRTQIGL